MKAYNLDYSSASWGEISSTCGEATFDICMLAPALVKGVSAFKGVMNAARGAEATAALNAAGKGFALSSGAENVNAAVNLNRKLSQLEKYQGKAANTKTLPDGRIRYYGNESPSITSSPTQGACNVTEWNPKTGSVRGWHECHDYFGKVNRVHEPIQLNI